jgi:hypothetical protein
MKLTEIDQVNNARRAKNAKLFEEAKREEEKKKELELKELESNTEVKFANEVIHTGPFCGSGFMGDGDVALSESNKVNKDDMKKAGLLLTNQNKNKKNKSSVSSSTSSSQDNMFSKEELAVLFGKKTRRAVS